MFQNETIKIRITCFKTRQLYANKMFQNDTIIQIKCFETRELYGNKMFQNERIIYG